MRELSTTQYLDKILPILSVVKDDKTQLAKILAFLEQEIIPEIEQEEDATIPEKYTSLVHCIAQDLETGMTCHFNLDTLETEALPESISEYEDITGFDIEIQHTEWDNAITIEPMESSQAFKTTERFAQQLDNNKVKAGYSTFSNNANHLHISTELAP
ncbi:MAG: hypothetical protein QM610_04065 [Chitinophagaceae bacterium]